MNISVRLVILAAICIGFATTAWLVIRNPAIAANPKTTPLTHTEWVVKSLEQMQTIHVGMKRVALSKVFTNEGGTYTATHRTYVYRECPYIKVDVVFNISSRNKNSRVTYLESPDDTIKAISKPYLAWGIMD